MLFLIYIDKILNIDIFYWLMFIDLLVKKYYKVFFFVGSKKKRKYLYVVGIDL